LEIVIFSPLRDDECTDCNNASTRKSTKQLRRNDQLPLGCYLKYQSPMIVMYQELLQRKKHLSESSVGRKRRREVKLVATTVINHSIGTTNRTNGVGAMSSNCTVTAVVTSSSNDAAEPEDMIEQTMQRLNNVKFSR
jgi:hypothetical protein